MPNPLLARSVLPRFSRIKAEHVEPAVEKILDANRARLREVLAGTARVSWNNTLKPLEDMDDDSWNEVINVNLTAAYRLTKGCIPAMKSRGSGRVLFTSSVQGNHVAMPGCTHYAASKAGLNGLIRSAAMELARYKVTVNGVEPGLVMTPGVNNVLSEERSELMARYVPLKRWGEPEEIAHAMLYLASDEAGYVTGQTLVVDGGALLPQNGSFIV